MKINWKYALGEILIVIIGISLAFSLNTWKENRSNQAIKRQYYENLASDIEREIEQLEANQLAIQAKIADIRAIRPFLGGSQERSDTLIRKFFNIPRSVNFYPQNATYRALVNSGDMKLIDNFELRRELEEHFALHKIILQNHERIDKIHENYLGDFFIYEIDFTKLREGDTSFMDKPLVGNLLNSIEGAYYMVVASNKEGIESNQALLEIIATEIAE